MRREYIRYGENTPIDIKLLHITEYPIHWHNALEIIFVLKGSIYLNVEAGTYHVREGEVEIVNVDEAHRMYSSEENIVLVLKIDTEFFSKYYSDIKNMFFYADTSEDGVQNTEEYLILRRFISILFVETIKRKENYQEIINKTLIELLYHLINNFHYLLYEKEELKEDEEQLQRYHRIVKYIYNNYQNKISLQEIAKKEFLSSHYLSHQIKNTMGVSFNEFLNLTRVEEAIKLLLDTDKTLTEISEELGFSHIRYFNKYFKKHYKMTPKEYRKKYKKTEEELKIITNIKEYPVDKSLKYLQNYLIDYPRYNTEEKIEKINLDLSKEGEDFEKTYTQKIYFGKTNYTLIKQKIDYLKQIQDLLKFNYVILENCFSIDVLLFKEGLKNIKKLGLKPYIVLSKSEEKLFFEKIEKIIEEYTLDDVENWIFEYETVLDDRLKFSIKNKIYKKDKNDTYNKEKMIPLLLKSIMQEDFYIQAFDYEDKLFSKEYGIIGYGGIKKPSYYALYFLSFLGEELISKGENYILTYKNEDYQLIVFNEVKNSTEKEKHFFINIENLLEDYRFIKFKIDENVGSSYKVWTDMGKPKELDDSKKQLLETISYPEVKFKFAKKSNIYPINFKIFGNGAVLIILEKVQKTH